MLTKPTQAIQVDDPYFKPQAGCDILVVVKLFVNFKSRLYCYCSLVAQFWQFLHPGCTGYKSAIYNKRGIIGTNIGFDDELFVSNYQLYISFPMCFLCSSNRSSSLRSQPVGQICLLRYKQSGWGISLKFRIFASSLLHPSMVNHGCIGVARSNGTWCPHFFSPPHPLS